MNATNPVQRRVKSQMASDELLEPCAQEGASFTWLAPARLPPEPKTISAGTWLAVAVAFVAIVAAIAMLTP